MSESQQPKKPNWLSPIEPMAPGTLDLEANASPVRQALNYLWIRLVIGLIGLVVLGTVLSLPRMWRSSPSDFLPVVRISLLDHLQCSSLQRQARRLQDEGKTEEAVLTWRQAIANNQASLEANRGLLRTLCAQTKPAALFLPQGLWQSQWLLRLTATNQSDLELVAHLCSRYEVDDLLLALLGPNEARLSDAAIGDLLKGLFRSGQMDQFGVILARHSSSEKADAELPLYRTAWQIGWGPVREIATARTRLEAAKSDPVTSALAHQLQLFISDSTADLTSYAQSLHHLSDLHADRPLDHVRYWRMLLASGQRDEAASLARAYATPPGTALEVRLMFDTFLQVELREYAAEFLPKHLPNFSFDPELWLRQAELLISLQRWDEVRMLALELRQTMRQPLGLTGYGWFIEGLANFRSHLPEPAGVAFRQIPRWPVENALLGYRIARELSGLGEPMLAKEVLVSLEKAAGKTADYWFHLAVAAYETHEFDTFFSAAAKAYELAPDDLININNYAAALLMQRQNSSLAAQLTLRKLTATPGDNGARLNHALALLQSGRTSEARPLLAQIDARQLDSRLTTILHLARFELNFRENQAAEALADHGQIEPRFLLAPQLRWLAEAHSKLSTATH
jgi:hypothetical protein